MTTNEGITLQLSGRSGLLAAVPALLGFHPQESLVLMCLSGPRRRLGPVLRVDLPTPAHPWDDHDYALLRYHARSNADEVALLWYTDAPLPPPAYDLLALIEADGTVVLDATVVRSDDHHAAEKHDARDDPDNPDDSADPDDPQAAMVSAVFALHGRRVLRDRESIRRSIAAPTGPGALAARAASREAAELLAHRLDRSGKAGAAGFAQWAAGIIDGALCAVTDGTPLPAGTAATIALVLVDPAVRDHCIGRVLDEPDAQWLPLLIAVATATLDLDAAQVCAVLALAAYRRGDGALAHVAVDRCLSAEPHHEFASLMLAAMTAGVHPDELAQLADPGPISSGWVG